MEVKSAKFRHHTFNFRSSTSLSKDGLNIPELSELSEDLRQIQGLQLQLPVELQG